jgi:hypothetical protein
VFVATGSAGCEVGGFVVGEGALAVFVLDAVSVGVAGRSPDINHATPPPIASTTTAAAA